MTSKNNNTTRLREVIQIGGEISGVLDCPANMLPEPGQYLPCQHLDPPLKPLIETLFLTLNFDGRQFLGPIPEVWQPGDWLAIQKPAGNGFQLPEQALRIGLAAIGEQPLRLLPLVPSALSQNAAVSLFAEGPLPPDLLALIPSTVEINPITIIKDSLGWLDYLAIAITRHHLGQLVEVLDWSDGQKLLPFGGQVLIRTGMPCHGIGACDVCSIKTRNGWQLICKDGPVFPLPEVLNVAK